jgi:hypothetical protein
MRSIFAESSHQETPRWGCKTLTFIMTFTYKGKPLFWRAEGEAGHTGRAFSLAPSHRQGWKSFGTPEVKEPTSFHLTRLAPYYDEAVLASYLTG